MIPYTNEEKEYIEFKLKYLDKLKDIKKDFDKLSDDNKTRVMLDFHNILPFAIYNFEQELKRRK